MKKLYNFLVAILAVISIVFVILDLGGKISLSDSPYIYIDTSILLFFTFDYAIRFFRSENRKQFFKSNIFDLVAIIPLNSLLQTFRIFRVFRLAKFTRLAKFSRLVRAAAFFEIIKKKIKGILNTNGLIYIIYINISLILASSVIMMFAEKMTFGSAFYWSIVTCTTVGYGDISPTTHIGRIVAIILMIFGIGLIGMLTGAITTYFTQLDKETVHSDDLNELFDSLSESEKQKIIEIIKIIKE